MIIFEIYNNTTRIHNLDPLIAKDLTPMCSYETEVTALREKGFFAVEDPYRGWNGIVCKLKYPSKTIPYHRIPTGLLLRVLAHLHQRGAPYQIDDKRVRPPFGFPENREIPLRDYQKKAVEAAVTYHRGVFDMVPRCQHDDDLIRLAKGGVKRAGDVAVGDQLLGPDFYPREVLSVHKGVGKGYEINTLWAKPQRVNGSHTLYVVALLKDFTLAPWITHQTKTVWIHFGDPIAIAFEVSAQAFATWPKHIRDMCFFPIAMDPEKPEAGPWCVTRYYDGITLGVLGSGSTPIRKQRWWKKALGHFGIYGNDGGVHKPEVQEWLFRMQIWQQEQRMNVRSLWLDPEAKLEQGEPTRLNYMRLVPFTISHLDEIPFTGWALDGDSLYLTDGDLVMHNSGKTRMMCDIVGNHIALPTVWIAPTDRIVKQTVATLEDFFGKHYAMHVVGSKNLAGAKSTNVAVCTTATARMLPKEFYDSREVLVVDEFHHAPAKSYRDIFDLCEHIYYRYGLTGTHYRSGGDAIEMHALISGTIAKVTATDLIKEGYLVPVDVYFVPVPGKFRRPNGSPNTFIGGWGKYGIHEHEWRNETATKIAAELVRGGRRVVIMCATKAQGRILHRMMLERLPPKGFQAEFHPCEFVSTDRPKAVIDAIFNSYNETREVQVLIGTSLVGEGVDLPGADALVYCKGEQAEVTLVQNAYRVCTASEGKERAIIVDFADRHHKKLFAHSESRLKTYLKDPAFTVHVTQSPEELIARLKENKQTPAKVVA